MAKVFLAFFNGTEQDNPEGVLSCFYESFINGLINAGNQVIYIGHNSWGKDIVIPPPDDLVQQLKDFNPDLIILFNNNFYDLSDYFDCPIFIYEADIVKYYPNKANIKNKPDRYKFLVGQTDSIIYLNNEFGVKSENICLGQPFTEVQAENISQATNISFIGTKFCGFYPTTAYNQFMQECPSEEEITIFKQIEESIIKNPYISAGELIIKHNLKSEKIIRCLNIDHLVFMISNRKRIQTLSQIADLGLDLYGTKNWISDLIYETELVLCYKNKSVYSLQHNQDIYNSSKLCININHTQATKGFAWRVCDIMASNGCLVSEFSPNFKQFFPNVPIPTFTNRFEAREQCLKLLNNENMRKDIVAQCQEIINQKYRFHNLLERFEDFLGINLGSANFNKSQKELMTELNK